MSHRRLPAPPDQAGSLVTAHNLGRRHPDGVNWLYQQIDLDIRPGDRQALVGPTGSGKSLVLRALALLDPVDQGEITWCGHSVADSSVPEYRGQVLYLQQRSPVVEGTVQDNLAIPSSLRLRKGDSIPQEQLDRWLRDLGRDREFLATSTSNLSGGERQLVALLRALMASPTVLLLDEPSAALDPDTTKALEQLVGEWHAEAPDQRAFVWVSHDPSQAQRVAQRIVTLEKGRMVATG